jgi:hypothetical protein
MEEEKKESLIEEVEEEEIMNRVGLLDVLVSKIISRKFLILVISTGFFYVNKLPAESWVLLAGIYMGSNAVIEVVKQWKQG